MAKLQTALLPSASAPEVAGQALWMPAPSKTISIAQSPEKGSEKKSPQAHEYIQYSANIKINK